MPTQKAWPSHHSFTSQPKKLRHLCIKFSLPDFPCCTVCHGFCQRARKKMSIVPTRQCRRNIFSVSHGQRVRTASNSRWESKHGVPRSLVLQRKILGQENVWSSCNFSDRRTWAHPVTSSSMAVSFSWHKLMRSLSLFCLFTARLKVLLYFWQFTSAEVHRHARYLFK